MTAEAEVKQMLQYERFEKIIDMLRQQPSVRVTDLVPILDASESTIRRDIAELDKEGRLRKVFGGAVALEAKRPGNGTNGTSGADAVRKVNVQHRDIDAKAKIRVDEKTKVAVRAAALIEEGDLVYIDAGTTTGSMIEHIDCYSATYVTNGVRHAIDLAERGFRTYLLSGLIKASTEAIIGYDAVDSLKKYHFDKCFIGTDGIDQENGLTTLDIEESMVKTEVIRRSGKVYVLADSSKFGLVAKIKFASLEAGTIITDQLPNQGFRSQTEIIDLSDEEERSDS